MDFLSYTKKKCEQRKESSVPVPAPVLPIVTSAHIEVFSLWEKYVIYDMCGATLASVKKVNKVCETCYVSCLHPKDAEPHPFSVICEVNAIAEGALVEVSDEVYTALAKAEFLFRETRTELLTMKVDVHRVLVDALNEYVWVGCSIPKCHDITTKILKRYFSIRWNIHGKKASAEVKAASEAVHASKSIARHALIQ